MILNYIRQNLLALDQLGNTLLGGWADETLSSRAYRADLKGRPWGRLMRPLIDSIFFWQKAHCRGAYHAELKRRHLPPDLQFQPIN